MPLGSAKVGLFGAAGVSTGGGDRGLKFLGHHSDHPSHTVYNVIEYITISSAGNGTDFGDATRYGRQPACASNGVTDRGLMCGGTSQASPGTGGTGSKVDSIEYVTISSTGNGTDFGDYFRAAAAQDATQGGGSNGTGDRAVWNLASSDKSQIGYNTVSSAGDSTDFGDRTVTTSSNGPNGAFTCNGTNNRGVMLGTTGTSTPIYNHTSMRTCDYITINSAGNATDFGDLVSDMALLGSCSNDTSERGIGMHGYNNIPSGDVLLNVIQYITINSAGNATDFGDLIEKVVLAQCGSNGVNERGYQYGGDGWNQNNETNTIQYITINSTGNASDFGDALLRYGHSGATDNGFT